MNYNEAPPGDGRSKYKALSSSRGQMCDKYQGQRPIKVNRSTCQSSGMNARLPLLPVTGHPMTASRRCDVTIMGVSNFLTFEPPGDGRSN